MSPGAVRAGLTAEALLVLLKHPLTHTGADRSDHLRCTRDLELHLRRQGIRLSGRRNPAELARADGAEHGAWADWIGAALQRPASRRTGCAGRPRPAASGAWPRLLVAGPVPASGTPAGSGPEPDGAKARRRWPTCAREAGYGGDADCAANTAICSARSWPRGEVRQPGAPSSPGSGSGARIEARVQGADLVILGGLNDGIWPQHAAARSLAEPADARRCRSVAARTADRPFRA